MKNSVSIPKGTPRNSEGSNTLSTLAKSYLFQINQTSSGASGGIQLDELIIMKNALKKRDNFNDAEFNINFFALNCFGQIELVLYIYKTQS